MDWTSLWTRLATQRSAVLAVYLLALMVPAIRTNNACDWTGSGLSTSRQNRDIISIYLQCSAGKIVWNYPRGAIRVVLRPATPVDQGFRACLKIHQFDDRPNPPSASYANDLTQGTGRRFARIYLEASKRLVPLYTNDDDQLVRCFSSVREQVGLYVEAEEISFEKNTRIVFEYNLEFVNNKLPRSVRSRRAQKEDIQELSSQQNTQLRSTNDVAFDRNLETATQAGSLGAFAGALWNRLWDRRDSSSASVKDDAREKTVFFVGDQVDKYNGGHTHEILNAMGDSWETCRPCSDVEMVHMFCSSDIVTRGNIFNIQERPDLETNEIIITKTKLLRDNMQETEYLRVAENIKNNEVHPRWIGNLKKHKISFHIHRHCPVSSGEGEFVFMGRLRFNEVMLACAPRLDEWAKIVYKFNETNEAPCILSS